MPTELLRESGAKWLTGDFSGEVALESIRLFKPDAIIHCAGTSLVGPSIKNPEEYYNNNFVKTKALCDFLLAFEHRPRLIFSSSAATYGNPVMSPCHEVDPTEPISPYGESKLMIEWLLKSYNRAYDLDYVAFRYFNACGADSQARHGQAPGATHIIPRIIENTKQGKHFVCNGNEYDTDDGTCVRDYLHVSDIADAHILALNQFLVPAGVYNLGSNQGTSNHEIIIAAQQVTAIMPEITVGPRRAGDPAILTASSDRFDALAGIWRRWNLNDMIRHTWEWYNR